MPKHICIHGHFYQPPRENPWLESIEPQDSAAPYHDWNEHINAECYAPNAASRILDEEGRIIDIVNNYSRISFDFGPTLLSWLQEKAPEVYRAVLEADRESRSRFSGHGSALAQVYNHAILPLATAEDKETQVVWGIRDFEHRFGRSPQGMWLPETAVDLPSLEVLAAHGIRFTILAPGQASRIRALGESQWREPPGGRIDTSASYLQRLPSGRSIAIFFYDGPVSRAVAFEGLLHEGKRFAERLLSIPQEDGGLAHIATDGESYGHHHPHGDMALAFALRAIEIDETARLTNYGEFLEKHPPRYEVEIRENTSWSCAHGIERWRSDCGCRTGGPSGWNQAWRGPLRASLDWLRGELRPQLRRAFEESFTQPRGVLLAYIDLILDRDPEKVTGFLALYAKKGTSMEEQVRSLKLLELERQLQLMYTSCGWFFNDLAGIETLQILRYAGRAVQLARDLFARELPSLEEDLLERLEKARSNRPEMGTGRDLYLRTVKPSQVTFESLAAHYCISALFEPSSESTSLYCYDLERQDSISRQTGRTRLVVGDVRLTSRITRASALLGFAVLHLGGHTVIAGVRRAEQSDDRHRDRVRHLEDPFERGDTTTVLRLIDEAFGPQVFDLKSLFGDEQRRVVEKLLRNTLEEAEAVHRRLYENHGATMRFLADLGVPPPRVLSVAAEVVLNGYLRSALASDAADRKEVESLIREAETEGVSLEETALAFTARRSLEEAAERYFQDPEQLGELRRLRNKVQIVNALPFEVELWHVQNLYFQAMRRLPGAREAGTGGRSWIDEFRALGVDLAIAVPESP